MYEIALYAVFLVWMLGLVLLHIAVTDLREIQALEAHRDRMRS
jgi:hypothetical protein